MDVRRREFITLLGGTAVAWPLAAHAQQRGAIRRIGVLMPLAADDAEAMARITIFVQALQELGWTAGHNLRIEYRWAANAERIGPSAAELVALAPDVILSTGSPATAALQQATRTVPIVFVAVTAPRRHARGGPPRCEHSDRDRPVGVGDSVKARLRRSSRLCECSHANTPTK
jgi:putative ABC transport system substrate-binding protein